VDGIAFAFQALGVVLSTVILVAAAVIVGTRRGLRESGTRLTAEQAATISAMSERIDALVSENARLKGDVRELQAQVLALRSELDAEKRITYRLRPDTP
jgi:predicted RNase H-like nuclease (RuvC/YqgF family)